VTPAGERPLESILAFLEEIGLSVREGFVAPGSFLPGIRVSGGVVVFDRAAMRWPGDLLHEAGHIATTPSALRAALDDALEASASVPHAGEVEATAWAYAAVVHLKLDASVLFHEGGYQGHSEGLVRSFGLGVYPGAHGLVQAGMTAAGTYPRMNRWMRE